MNFLDRIAQPLERVPGMKARGLRLAAAIVLLCVAIARTASWNRCAVGSMVGRPACGSLTSARSRKRAPGMCAASNSRRASRFSIGKG